MLGSVLDGVINQVADHLEQQVTITFNHYPRRQLLGKALLLVFRQGFIKLTGIIDQLIQRHHLHIGGIAPGFQPGNPQQGIEGGQQLVGFRNGTAYLFPGFVVIYGNQGVFQLVTQAGQRGAKVVGDAVRYMPDTFHQVYNPVEHLVQVFGQLVKVVFGTPGRYPQRQVPVHDPSRGVVDYFNAPRGTSAHQKTTQQGQGQGNAHAPVDGGLDHPLQAGQLIHIPADQQAQATLNIEDPGPGQAFRPLPAHGRAQGKVDPATVGRPTAFRPGFNVSGQLQEVIGSQQVNGLGVRIPGDTLTDDGDQPVHATPAVLFRQAGNFRLDGFVGLGGHKAGGAPVDEGQKQEYRGGKHHHVQQCQLER